MNRFDARIIKRNKYAFININHNTNKIVKLTFLFILLIFFLIDFYHAFRCIN